jgi:hypothetical protein
MSGARPTAESELRDPPPLGRESGSSVTRPIAPYLRLVRAPAVFSALGDPIAGLLIAGEGARPRNAIWVCGAAAAFYLAGMTLNDVADFEEDALLRADRPIPTGEVSRGSAALLGAGLLGAGLLASRIAGARRTGPALAGAVVAYDFALKRSSILGPLAMGSCRALSLLMGAEAGGRGSGLRRAASSAALLGSYVSGLTVLARGETGPRDVRAVTGGAAIAAAAIAAVAGKGGRRAVPWAATMLVLAGPAVVRAVREPAPTRVGPAVGALIRVIPALDAALAAPRAPVRSLALLPLLGLVRWGRKLIPIH